MKSQSHLTTLQDTFKVLSEENRIRILSLLEESELRVNEIQSSLDLKQSTLSVHLKLLKNHNLVTHRREGKNIFYQMTSIKKLGHSKGTVLSVLALAKETKWHQRDQQKLKNILEIRTKDSIEFFDSQTSSHYPLDLNQIWLNGFLGLVQNKKIIDLGCGSGDLISSLVQANQNNQIYGVDNSSHQLKLAKAKITALAKNQNINIASTHLIKCNMEETTFDENFFDLAIISNSLHHTSSPVKVIQEIFRILKNQGNLLIFDLNQHEHEDIKMKYGDFWMGFNCETLSRWLVQSGFELTHYQVLENKLDNQIDPIVVLAKKVVK